MSSVITETAANANFVVGLTKPDPGESGNVWWSLIDNEFQQLADRSQWLKAWHPDTPVVNVPLVPVMNVVSRFTVTHNAWATYWLQDDVTSSGGLVFQIPGLVVGRKITGVSAYWRNPGNTTLPVQNMPGIALISRSNAVGTTSAAGTTVASQLDATAVVATYQASHTIAITGLSVTIAADSEYYIRFTGESGTNAVNQGQLLAVRATLAF